MIETHTAAQMLKEIRERGNVRVVVIDEEPVAQSLVDSGQIRLIVNDAGALIAYEPVESDQRRVRTMATAIEHQITFSNYRVEYSAPDYSKGHTFEPRCAILADDAEFDGATVRVFDVPDPDESQRAVAQFACDAMNAHNNYQRLLKAAMMLLAMNNCNYDRAVMRSEGGFDALERAVMSINPDWKRKEN